MYKSETDFFVKFHTFFPTHIVKNAFPTGRLPTGCLSGLAHDAVGNVSRGRGIVPLFLWQFINCTLWSRDVCARIRHRKIALWDGRNIGLLWAKVRRFKDKSTEVCIKEVRCFGFPDWRSVPNIGRDTDFDNKTINNRQLYNAKKGIPFVTYLSQLESRQKGLQTRHSALWICPQHTVQIGIDRYRT